MKPLYQRLHLYTEGNDTYIFAPAESGINTQSFTIHRSSRDIVLNRPNEPLPIYARCSPRTIYGIVGLISLSLSEYIIVLTGRELRGRLMGHEVYRATDFDILPLNPVVSTDNSPHPVEGHLLALVRSHLRGGNFFFSYEWDLTRRMQAQWETRDKEAGKYFWEMADDRFFWNRFLQSRLIDATTSDPFSNLGKFILPIIYGTFDLRPVFVHGRHMQLCLISRKSRFRAGTRYFRRGIDHEGHVANFNETEQILLVEDQTTSEVHPPLGGTFAAKLSFVQIRGSIPVYWAEVNTLMYKPDLQIMDLQDTVDVMHKHLQEQVSIYGEQALVNLVNQKGYERPMKEAYERYFAQMNLPQVQYRYFDFHHECRNMHWDRITVLIDKMKDDLERQGYFYLDASQPSPVKLQRGTVRTNCMDTLDRTNVVQAALAKWTLHQQLIELGILSPSVGVDNYEGLSKDLREMWANHADEIATAYGGSAALKSDFTRTNKRTRKGAFDDVLKSIQRYLKNNYFDGARQDAFDLMTGNWTPRKNPSATMFLVTDTRPLLIRSMPFIASFSLFMICAGLTLPRTSDYSLFYYFMLWFTLLSVVLLFILIHGIAYVSWPRLIPPTDVIYYSGPGFRSANNGKGINGDLTAKKVGRWLRGGKAPMGIEEVEMGTIKKRVD